MSTPTLSQMHEANYALVSDFSDLNLTIREYKGKGSNTIFAGVPVFRSGTFRDSWGDQKTWEDIHLDQMVSHYDILSSRKILESVPVRDGHPSFLSKGPGAGQVVGWHHALETKKINGPVGEYTYLLADYEITDPAAVEKIRNGTWRNRSAEVGQYTTNDESTFYPVYMGVAWVDFSAVEGLNLQGKYSSAFSGPERKLVVMLEREIPVPPETNPQTKPQAPVIPVPPTFVNPAPPASPQQHAAPLVPTTLVQPATEPGQPPSVQPFVFTMGGVQTSDYAAVQTRLQVLEQFEKDTREQNRKNFVAGLARDNKILASQVEQMEGFALGLSPEQFTAWENTFTNTSTQQVLGNHDNSSTGASTSGDSNRPANEPKGDKLSEYDLAVQVVDRLKTSGMSDAQVAKTPSYARMIKLAPKQPAAS